MRDILCYGDSNTWGYIAGSGARFAYDVRWPGVAAAALGGDYHIVEAGLNGRTTMWDWPYDAFLNGRDYLLPEIFSHYPLDLVVLMLGTNDLNLKTPWEIAYGSRTLINLIRSCPDKFRSYPPRILLVSPIHVSKNIKQLSDGPICENGYEYSLQLADQFRKIADKCKVDFLDAAQYAQPSLVDGIHMDEHSHKALGLAIADKILTMF